MPNFLTIGGLGTLVTLVGLFMVKQDIRLRTWGEQVEGRIDGVWMQQGRLRRGSSKVRVGYTFPHKERGLMKGSFSPPSDWKPAEDLKVQITFLPYAPHICRTEFESTQWPYGVTLIGMLMVGVGLWMFFSESVVDSNNSTRLPSKSGRGGEVLEGGDGKYFGT